MSATMEQATQPQPQPHPRPGEKAPDFRLAAAGGGEIALSDFLGRKNLLMWFSKGLHCPFCRRSMARLSQAYAQFLALDAEVLQITHNTQEEAKLYFRNYKLATPYLCDPDRQVHLRYGIALEQQTISAVAANSVTSCLMVTGDLLLHGQKSPLPVAPIMRMGARFQSPQLVVAADRAGVVRHLWSIGPFDTLPTVAELLAVLEPLRRGPASAGQAG
jgi:peroxiredoxin